MKLIPRRARERRLIILFGLAWLLLATAVWQAFLSPGKPEPAAAIAPDSAQAVTFWQTRLTQYPAAPAPYAQLGLAYLQQVRETGDTALYTLAEQAFNSALTYDPRHLDALIGHGVLALARHDFAAALAWGEKARAQNPYRAQTLGILVDAYVELGRYEEAVATAQAMVDLRPDLASYSRVSYLRELHGDVAGAMAAMETAVSAGTPGSEQTAWARVQLGHLYLEHGRLDEADAVYREALHHRPDYPYALAGLAKVYAAQENYTAAMAIMQPLVIRLPLPEFAIFLGDLYAQTGNRAQAEKQYELVRQIQQLNAAAGVSLDPEMVLFAATHGDAFQAVAMARSAYSQQPNLYAADALAWALYQNNELAAAWDYSQEALRLGTLDAPLYCRAAQIARALGDETTAHQFLDQARAINPVSGLRQC